MQALPVNESLLFEAVRAIHWDMAFMLTAAKRCVAVEEKATTASSNNGSRHASSSSSSSPRSGGCQNIVLDDITPNFTAGYQR